MRRRLLGLAGALLLAATTLGIVPTASPASAAVDPCGSGGNKIACENSKPGTPASVWDITGAGAEDIQGFATDISVNLGGRVDLKIDTTASAYSITIFRTGWYGGDGARQVATVSPSAVLPQRQPQCITDTTTELYDCGNWGVSASWTVPTTAVSGVYVALLRRSDNGHASHITFIVRDDASTSDVVFQTSDPTWQAYNTYGGSDFYQGAANGRAYEISYNRPVLTRGGIGGRDFYFANEYPAVRFLERNGYDVSYVAGVDTDRYGATLLPRHRVFMSVGHDEYWSKGQRANVEAARDAGVNLMFLSGNEVYWKTRYEASADPAHTAYRTLVSYKETWANDKIDPSAEWTGTWRDPRFAPRSAGAGRPENALTGTLYTSNFSDLPLTVSNAEGRLRLWRGTSLATTTAASTALAPHTVGYESDEDLDNGARPPGLIRLSTTTGDVPEYLQDFGNTTAPGTTTHHLTLYRAPSGALVFGAGTVQWSWGLDATHDTPYAAQPADVRMQQAQVNLLADMAAQPTTLAAGLAPATRSTDTTGPATTISSPAAGAAVANGALVTVTGTATDTGGRVAGVEVSSDSGATWHPATGTSSWSYTYVQHGIGTVPLQARATDDSANTGPVASRSLAVSCPCTVHGATVPATPATTDGGATELGLRFTPTSDGFVTGVRFYKGTGNTGPHLGTLWSAGGAQLARASSGTESATGWQTVSFGSPVAVSAGTTYVVSYSAPNGHYAAQPFAFSSGPLDADPLTVAGGFGTDPAGVYASPGQFPVSSYRRTSYFVDPVFTATDASPLAVTSPWPTPGSSSVPSSTTVSGRFSKPLATGTAKVVVKDANGAVVSGSTSYDAGTRVVTFTPTTPLAAFVTHTVTVSGTDTSGGAVGAGGTWSFTTARPPSTPGVCPCSLFDDTLTPSVLEVADTAQVTLGVRVTPTVDGSISGVRFYKGVGNTGSHVGTLWSAAGTKLAEGTFGPESTSGWQTLAFATAVPVTAGTTYVASYRTDVGRYSATPNAFAGSDLSRGPLSVTSSAGAYVYGASFPTASTPTSYLVDVVFARAAASIAVTSRSPAPGAVDVPRGTPVTTTFSTTVQGGWSVAVTQQPAGTAVPGSASLDASGKVLTFTPTSLLAADSDIQVVVSGVRSTEGAVLPTQTWTFHTRGPDSATSQSLFTNQVPQVQSAAESSPVELGTTFVPAKDGRVTAIRFYKGAGNGGTHTGSLWSASGARLATVTFGTETASGWQSASLSPAVAVTAGTTYVVSYLATQGGYSYTSGFFATPFTNGDLSVPATTGGRYLYGAGGGFPTYSYGSANYFVDVVFEPTPPTMTVVGRTPAPGAADVPRAATPSMSFSAGLADGWSMTLAQGTTPVTGAASRSADGRTVTFTPGTTLPASTTFTATVSAITSTEGATLPPQSWTFTTEAGASTLSSLFPGAVPQTPATADSGAVELGVSFVPAVNGSVTAIRFWKGAGNTGTHTGSIWSATGTLLATVTFTGESASGWQTQALSTPLALTAGATYVVSYHAPRGSYASTPGYFSSAVTSGPLTAPAAGNGRYRYGSSSGFPTGTWNATNYFVDLVFRS